MCKSSMMCMRVYGGLLAICEKLKVELNISTK